MEKKTTSTKQRSTFDVLNAINVNDHVDKKNGLTYLSWAWAWQEVKKNYPDATYTIYENADGWNYHTDGRTCWVKTGVTINGQEHIEDLPVMDYRNNSIPLDKVTSTDVNKAIQRSLTKACARHGLGLYIYAGEDLPSDAQEQPKETPKPVAKPKAQPKQVVQPVAQPQGEELLKAIAEANACVSVAEIKAVWEKYSYLRTNDVFRNAVTARGKEIAA